MSSAAAIQRLPEAAPATMESHFPVQFLGSGSEYFRIWIVNLLLTLVTLGLYSPWAKVRRLQYMYRNTQVAGSSFDYHGNPVAILKGRLIAGVLLVAYNLSFELSLAAGLIVLVVLLAVSPWLLRQALRFRLRNSSWRGIRFRFDGELAEACWIVLPVVVLTAPIFIAGVFGADDEPPTWFFALFFGAIALYLAVFPYLHYRLKRYQHGCSRLGTAEARFTGTAGSFYVAYGVVGLLVIGAGAIAALVVAGVRVAVGTSNDLFGILGFAIGAFVFYMLFIVIGAAYVALLQNRVWNRTELGELCFQSTARTTDMARIYMVNVLGIIFTLGLFTPFAVIRSLKYRLEVLSIHAPGGMDDFVAVASEDVGATGEGAVDLFDIDLGL